MNTEFPHRCVVYHTEGVTSFNPDGEITEIYSGKCRKSSSTNIRTFNSGSNSTGKVDTCDYRVSVPGIHRVSKGDIIEVDDGIHTERMRVVSYETTNLRGGRTAVLCNSASN